MQTKLNVLVACESSATVRDAFRELGHNAWSCDLLPCDGDPSFHYQGDVMAVLRGELTAVSTLGRRRVVPKQWDLLIAHPPCTYLCNSGARWLYKWVASGLYAGLAVKGVRLDLEGRHWATFPTEYQVRDEPRWTAMREGARFFNLMLHADSMFGIPHVAVENPIMHRHARAEIAGATRNPDLLKPDQIIQPYQFGHPESKATCLWLLGGLPKLTPTKIVPPTRGSAMHKLPPSKDRWKLRSKTYQGIADAMAEQWSAYILEQKANAAWLKGTPPGYND